jgi:hypothetical protein
MAANQILQSVASMFKLFPKKQLKNLGLLVAALARARRAGVAILGRHLRTGTRPKHAIKRVDRFFSNQNFDSTEAQEIYLRTVIGPRQRILVAVDWTKIRQWPVLFAGLVHHGRTIPMLWAVLDPRRLHKSQNAFEHGFFTWLADTLPKGVSATILLDRGFKRVDLLHRLERLGLRYVVRTGGNVCIEHEQFCGPAEQLLCRRGERVDLRGAILRPSRPVRTRVVGVWEPRQKEPWLLMTNLSQPVEHIVAYYAKRFRIEEMFRDEKDWRLGVALGHQRVTRPDRLERMLLVVSLWVFLALLIGGEARRLGYASQYRANTEKRRPTHSDFTLGSYYWDQLDWSFPKLLEASWAEHVPTFGG